METRTGVKEVDCIVRALRVVLVLGTLAVGAVHAGPADWDETSYRIVAGDFNGDGFADLLFLGRNGNLTSAILLADSNGDHTIVHQTWSNGHLGIDWGEDAYNVVVGDFSGDGRSDIFLQGKSAGAASHVIVADSAGKFTAIRQSIPSAHLGLDWSAASHRIVAGDFNKDGRADLVLQATSPGTPNATVTANSDGTFGSVLQQWNNDYLGLDWSTVFHVVHVGDFNGDGLSDLFLQVKTSAIVLPLGDDFTVMPILPRIHNAILLAGADGRFTSIYDSWSADHLGIDWRTSSHDVIIGDFNGDGKSDILLQPLTSSGTVYQLLSDGNHKFSSVYKSWQNGYLGKNWSKDLTNLLAADFNKDKRTDLLLQARKAGQASSTVRADSTGQFSENSQQVADTEQKMQQAVATAVGTTTGALGVSPSGAATYTIPIVVPPGTNGMQPSLSLVYNSQAGDGPVGMGWGIGGLSVIHRCGATIAIDGFKGGVNYDSDDRFCLDGERLIHIGSNEYRTQHESWQRVVAYGPNAWDPQYFVVTAKDGTQRTYGNPDDNSGLDARIEAQGTSIARLWALKKVRDRSSNYMTFSYTEQNSYGDYRPYRIAYSGNEAQGTQPKSYVQFSYGLRQTDPNRPDIVPLYEGGSAIKLVHRVSAISTYSVNPASGAYAVVRNYKLGYDNAGEPSGTSGRSRLVSIQECDGVSASSTCFAPTSVSWGTHDRGMANTFETGWLDGGFLEGRAWVDVNGDGKADYCRVVGKDDPPEKRARCTLSNGTGFGADVDSPLIDVGHKYTRGWADVDGDGRADFCRLTGDWNPTCTLSQGTSFGATIYLGAAVNSEGLSWVDFNGDGKADVCRTHYLNSSTDENTGITTTTAEFICSLSTGTSFSGHYSTGETVIYDHQQWADVNGDGRADICMEGGGSLKCILSTGTGFGATITGFSGDSGYVYPAFVDFNGDGKSDFCRVFESGSVACTVSTGKGFGSTYYSSSLSVGSTSGGRQWVDANGDGKTDFCRVTDQNESFDEATQTWVVTSPGYAACALSTGTRFVDTTWSPVGNTGEAIGRAWADFDGDGRADYLRLAGGLLASLTNPSIGDKVTAISNGQIELAIAYKQLTDPSVHIPGAGTVVSVGLTRDVQRSVERQALPSSCWSRFCFTDPAARQLKSAMSVVAQTYAANGLGGWNSSSYTYNGFMYHNTAAIPLGFARQNAKDDQTGVNVTTYYNQSYDQGLEGTVWGVDTAVGSRTLVNRGVGTTTFPILTKSVRSTYENKLYSNQPVGIRRLPLLAKADETSWDTNGAFVSRWVTVSEFNSAAPPQFPELFYFPTRVTTTSLDPTGQPDGYSKSTTTNYQSDAGNWIVGLPDRVAVTATAPNKSPLVRTSSFTYKPGTALVDTETIEPDIADLRVVTTHGYDNFGNRETATVSGAGVETRTATAYFDALGRFPVRRINAAGHTETYEHDWRTGQPTKVTAANGLSVTRSYDGFGRLATESRPDGTQTTQSFEWTFTGYAVTTHTTGGSSTWVSYDTLGREIRKAVQGFEGSWIFQDKTYNALGRLEYQSRPYFLETEDPKWVYYQYDGIGRPWKVTQPGNRTSETLYNGRETTVINALGQRHRSVKNSQGWLVEAEDAGGILLYEHDPFGNVTKVVHPNPVVVTTMDYNIRGHKIGMQDPDMGSWTYGFDALGQLRSQVDAKGQTQSVMYDLLGRMKSRTTPEGASTWTYDDVPATARPSLGRLVRVDGPNGYVQTMSYDGLARPDTVSTIINGQSFVVKTGYDAIGRVGSVTYPNDLVARYNYTDTGYLHQVLDTDNRLLWQVTAMDAHRRIVQESFGAGLITEHTYNPTKGDLEAIRTLGVAGEIQNLKLQFDDIGNLLARNDATQGKTETFTYDGLNRLKTVSGPASKTYDYDTLGNIISKSDVGTYEYNVNGPRPHAVNRIVNGTQVVGTFSYDDNGNMESGMGRTIAYFSFNKPSSITANGVTSTFAYDANFSRIVKTTPAVTTLYVGKLFEQTTSGATTETRATVFVGSKQIAQYVTKTGTTAQWRYFHPDHLGSPEVVTNDPGQVIERLSFDPWGKRRPSNWQDGTVTTGLTRPGYTGHEMDDESGLINMNAREYDPALGRFLTPDTIIQFPASSQGYNRYTYVNNNPLSFTDPMGHSVWRAQILFAVHTAVGFLAGGPAGAMAGAQMGQNAYRAHQNGVSDAKIFANSARSFVVMAMTAEAFKQVGGSATIQSSAILKITAHAMVGGVMSVAGGGSFRDGALGAGVAAAAGLVYDNPQEPGLSLAYRMTVGGIAARAGGGSAGMGAFMAGMGYLFNDLAHSGRQRTGTWDPVTDQRIGQLDPNFQPVATEFINTVEGETGIQLRVTAGYRSAAEQDALYAIGRTEPGNIVTNARGGESLHNSGLAVDVVQMQNGRPNWTMSNSSWESVGQIGERLGMQWGGRWQSFPDRPHFQWSPP